MKLSGARLIKVFEVVALCEVGLYDDSSSNLSVCVMVPSNGKYALSCGKWARSCRKRASAKSTLPPFYKEFERGRKFGRNGIETGVHNFFGGHSSGNQGLLQLALGSLAMGNML